MQGHSQNPAGAGNSLSRGSLLAPSLQPCCRRGRRSSQCANALPCRSGERRGHIEARRAHLIAPGESAGQEGQALRLLYDTHPKASA